LLGRHRPATGRQGSARCSGSARAGADAGHRRRPAAQEARCRWPGRHPRLSAARAGQSTAPSVAVAARRLRGTGIASRGAEGEKQKRVRRIRRLRPARRSASHGAIRHPERAEIGAAYPCGDGKGAGSGSGAGGGPGSVRATTVHQPACEAGAAATTVTDGEARRAPPARNRPSRRRAQPGVRHQRRSRNGSCERWAHDRLDVAPRIDTRRTRARDPRQRAHEGKAATSTAR